jgi:DNA/RNA-binding domain of Phe-tRNA-synthetase-like protein
VHDLDKLKGGVTFRRSAGGEPFRSVGTASAKVTAEGDYLYADDLQVLAWLDARDSDTVKLGPESKNVLIVVQGTSATTREYTRAAIEDAAARIVTYCGGSFSVADVL